MDSIEKDHFHVERIFVFKITLIPGALIYLLSIVYLFT